nr:CPBP family intramembrane glutamic endopeptidase [Amylibacter sp.]
MLPQMNDKFDAFIAPAREHTGGLLFLGAVLFLLLAYTELTFGIIGLFGLGVSLIDGTDIAHSFSSVSGDIADPVTPQSMIAVLVTFISMLAAVWLTVGLFRGQSIRTLLGTGAVLRNFLITCAVMAPVVAVFFLVTLSGTSATPNLPLPEWIFWMLPALPLLLIQVSSEELVFRGYLMQEFAMRFSSRWIWIVLPSLIFGCLHFDPSKFGSNGILVVLATTLFGVIASDLTIRTGNLGAAIGLHFMNNFMAMMLVSLDGTMNGLSLFVTQTHVSQHSEVRGFLLTDIGSIVVLYGIYLLGMRWIERRRERQLSRR